MNLEVYFSHLGVGKALDEESLFTEKSWEAVNYGSKNVGGLYSTICLVSSLLTSRNVLKGTHYYKSVGANQGQSTESVVDAVLGELLKNEGGHKVGSFIYLKRLLIRTIMAVLR